MHPRGRLLAEVTLMLVPLAPQSASAAPLRGDLGAQSRASIEIRVSVVPRFHVGSRAGALEVSSNAPTLRYDLVLDDPARSAVAPARVSHGAIGDKQPLAIQDAAVPPSTGNLLVLVVPD